MDKSRSGRTENERLTFLWEREFGDEYIKRNIDVKDRRKFWEDFIKDLYPWEEVFSHKRIILEVGCGIGVNLKAIQLAFPTAYLWGIDVNDMAIKMVNMSQGIYAIKSTVQDIEFPSKMFDLVYSCGVLIHIPNEGIQKAISEMKRVSKRYVLIMEYYAKEEVVVKYQGEKNALFKRPYGELFLKDDKWDLVSQGAPSEGFDKIVYWLFKRKDNGNSGNTG